MPHAPLLMVTDLPDRAGVSITIQRGGFIFKTEMGYLAFFEWLSKLPEADNIVDSWLSRLPERREGPASSASSQGGTAETQHAPSLPLASEGETTSGPE